MMRSTGGGEERRRLEERRGQEGRGDGGSGGGKKWLALDLREPKQSVEVLSEKSAFAPLPSEPTRPLMEPSKGESL